MKTRSLTNWSLVPSLLGLLFVGGGIQQNAGNAQALLNPTNAEPLLTNAQPAAAVPNEDTSIAGSSAAAALPVPLAEPILPPTILPATPLAEVVKLAQSGVDDGVLLSFVTNSIKPFELDAEKIVYLNDLGVSSSVITTMMQHDQGLKPAPASPAPTTASEPEPVASAPSYVSNPSAAPAAEAPPQTVSNNYFYDSLAPYGNWIEVEGYGRCWQPTVVVANRNWQPYCDRGRWVYTDAGWYWLSDYSWGATAFHYGRWFSHPSRGWCWWPDTVWAASWVNWRYSGSYCGWAPLPPAACYQAGFGFSYYGSSVGFGFAFGLGASAYTFVPWGGFCAARPYQYRVPVHQATQIYNNTTVINNYGNGNDNTVINKGISPDRVRQYARTEVRTVKLREQAVGGSRNERLERDGRTLVVHRPSLSTLNASRENLDQTPVRTSPPKANETTIARPPQNPAKLPLAGNGRGEVGIERGRLNGNAPAQVSPTTLSKTPGTSSTRVEVRPSREPQHRLVGDVPNPARASSPVTVRSTGGTLSPTSVPTSAPKVYQSRIVEGASQNTARPSSAAPSGSLIVIGGKGATRSGGRDYSVWNTPSPAPISSAPASSPRAGVPSQSVPLPTVSLPTVTETRPGVASRVQVESDVASRGSYSTFATQSPRPSSLSPRPGPVDSAPSLSPQPASQSRPPNGQRFESRSTSPSAGPAMSPTRPQSGPGSNSNPSPRSP